MIANCSAWLSTAAASLRVHDILCQSTCCQLGGAQNLDFENSRSFFVERAVRTFDRRCCSRSRLIFSGTRSAREACHRRPSQQRHSLENSLASVHAWTSGAPYPMLLASGGRVHIVLALAAMSPSCFIQLVSSGKPFAGLAEMCEPALSNFTCKLSWQMSDGR